MIVAEWRRLHAIEIRTGVVPKEEEADSSMWPRQRSGLRCAEERSARSARSAWSACPPRSGGRPSHDAPHYTHRSDPRTPARATRPRHPRSPMAAPIRSPPRPGTPRNPV